MCLVSPCKDYNCLYITGESDHGMGLEATGNSSDVWRFHFATSFSFSLVEQLVGNNIWNTTQIGSVTLGLFESYLNNETLELFYSNGYLFLKRENDNSTLLFLDKDTGIVRDIFNNYGLLGTMPCYHDNVTENAWNYGFSSLDNSSDAYNQLKVVFGICLFSPIFAESGLLASIPLLGEISLGPLILVSIPILIILRPDIANALWMEFAYLLNPNAREYPDIPIYEGTDLNIYRLFYNHNPVIINPEDEKLYDYYNAVFAKQRGPDKDFYRYRDKKLNIEKNNEIKISNAPSGPDKPDSGTWYDVGEYIKEFKEDFASAEGINKFFVVKDNLLELCTVTLLMFSEETFFEIILYCIVQYLWGNDNSSNSTKDR